MPILIKVKVALYVVSRLVLSSIVTRPAAQQQHRVSWGGPGHYVVTPTRVELGCLTCLEALSAGLQDWQPLHLRVFISLPETVLGLDPNCLLLQFLNLGIEISHGLCTEQAGAVTELMGRLFTESS